MRQHGPVTERGDGTASSRVHPDRAWGRATLALQLTLFAIPAAIAWRSSLDRTVYIPMIALAITFAVGGVLLMVRAWRGAGGRIAAATVLAAAIEVGLTVVLVLAYGTANPGWDLS